LGENGVKMRRNEGGLKVSNGRFRERKRDVGRERDEEEDKFW